MSEQAKRLIEQNLETKNSYLDLGNCGLTGHEPSLDLLAQCEHLDILIFSNWWWDYDEEGTQRIGWASATGAENHLMQIPKNLPKSLKKLVLAGVLDESINDISPLKHLSKLKILYLSDNYLQDIAALENLKKLQILNLALNAISTFSPKLIQQLTDLDELYLRGNPLENIPREVFERSGNVLKDTQNYFLSIQNQATDYLHQAKMLLIGNAEVGKSSIRIRLLDKNAPLPSKEDRTQGLDIETYHISNLKVEELDSPIPFDLHIWDFGGQGKYREVQQLFCSHKSLYLFVTSPDDQSNNENYVGWQYWLSMAKAYGYHKRGQKDSPILHVINKIDLDRDFEVNNKDRKKLFPNIGEFVKISCKNLENFNLLENAIQRSLNKLTPSVFTNRFNRKWIEVKEILASRSKENHISFQKYLGICLGDEFGMSLQDAEQWISILDRIGTVIYFRDHPHLKNWIILNPLWVKISMYRVLDSTLISHGHVYPKYLTEIWREYTPEEQKKLLELMIHFKFCYPQKDQFDQTYYIIPALLANTKPQLPKYLENFDFELSLKYEPFLPAGTVNKLMVELNSLIYQDLKWKNHVILHQIDEQGQTTFAQIQENWQEQEIKLWLKGSQVGALFLLIKLTLLRLSRELKDTKMMEKLDLEVFAFHKNKLKLLKDLEEFEVEKFTPFYRTKIDKSIRKTQEKVSEDLNLEEKERLDTQILETRTLLSEWEEQLRIANTPDEIRRAESKIQRLKNILNSYREDLLKLHNLSK